MRDEELINIVAELNDHIFTRTKEAENNFSFYTNGIEQAVSFGEHILWCSDDDNREWIKKENDYEPFEPFIKRVFNEYVTNMYKLRILTITE